MQDEGCMVGKFTRMQIAEGKGDPTPPQFDCCGNVTQ